MVLVGMKIELIEGERPSGENPPLPTYHDILNLLCREFEIPGSPSIWSAIEWIKKHPTPL